MAQIPFENIVFDSENAQVGEGEYGMVHKCHCYGVPAVVKIMKYHDDETIRRAKYQVDVFSRLSCPNLVNVYGCSIDPAGRFMIVMENGGIPLSQYLDDLRSHNELTPTIIYKCILQMVTALKCLRDHHIFHGDFAIKNMVISEEGVIKLCDFDFFHQCPVYEGETQWMHVRGFHSTAEILAPECYYERYVHPVCDVYSLAAFAISLFKSGPVYRPEEINGLCTSAALLEAVVNQGFRPAIPGCVPEDVRMIISSCLVYEGTHPHTGVTCHRPTLEEFSQCILNALKRELVG